MIAIVAVEEKGRRGPIPVAFAHAGFETREAATIEEAAGAVAGHALEECVLVVDADALASPAGRSSWATFLTRHPRMPAVVVTRGEADGAARSLTDAPHRVLLPSPFDAAAVVGAARRAASALRPPVRRVPQRRDASAERTG